MISPRNSLSWNNIQLLNRKVNKESSHKCLWSLNFCSPDPFQRAEIGTEIDNLDRLYAVAESWDVVSGPQNEIPTLYPVVTPHHRRGERDM
jgi:hypothetical protein